MASRINQAILRSEQRRAERTLAELNTAVRDEFIPRKTMKKSVNPNPSSVSFVGVRGAGKTIETPRSANTLGLAGSITGIRTGLLGRQSNPPQSSPFGLTTTSGTLSAQVRKNQMKRKAHLKAQSLAREDEELSKQQMKQIKDREARRAREAEESETKMNWIEPDGSKTILKFDEDGNLLGREVTKPTEEFLSTEELIKQREIARRKEEADDGRLQRDRKGNALSQRKYREAWLDDPRSKKILKQVSGGI